MVVTCTSFLILACDWTAGSGLLSVMGISFSFVPIGGLSGRCALRYLSLSCHSLVFTHFTAFIGTQNLEVFREKESNGLSYFFDSLLVGVLFNFIIYGFGKLGFCC